MRIVGLKAHNVKRIVAVEIAPDGTLVVVAGKNGAGKTSVLDSVAYALGGAALCPEVPIRRGATTASVEVSLGDKGVPELVVRRTWTEGKGSVVKVVNADETPQTPPQTILDKLLGKLTFDPLAFTEMEPVKQRALLQQLVGLDLQSLDDRRRRLFDRRAMAGRDVHGRQTQIESVTVYPEAGMTETSVSQLVDELGRANDINAQVADTIAANDRAREQVKNCDVDVAHHDQLVQAAQADLHRAEERAWSVREEARVAHTAAEHAVHSRVDVGPLRQRIAVAEDTNRKVRANQIGAQLKAQFDEAQSEFDRLDSEVKKVDAEKAAKLSEAKFPVPGLGFSDGGITLNGLPFEQASSAEQLRVSVAMGLALNPTLRVMLIRDASLLDADNRRLVREMAESADAQVWMEVVGDGGESAVVIEDGQVKA